MLVAGQDVARKIVEVARTGRMGDRKIYVRHSKRHAACGRGARSARKPGMVFGASIPVLIWSP